MAEDFEKRTLAALKACAKWLDENAEHLAHEFSEGCREWSVEFSAGVDGMFPEIDVSVTKFDRGILDAVMQSRDVMDYPGVTEQR